MAAALPVLLAVGVGSQLFGTFTSMQAAKKQSEFAADQAAQEQKAEAVRQQQAQLDAQRRMLEMVRNQNRARALALSNAVSGGAQYSSGLQGGYGQISGETNTNLLGVSQNLELGTQLFGINSAISQDRIGYAQAQGQYAFGSGLSSLGGALVSSIGPIGRLSGGFGYTNQNSAYG